METQNYFSISKGISTTRGDGRLRELRSDKGFEGMDLNGVSCMGKQEVPRKVGSEGDANVTWHSARLSFL